MLNILIQEIKEVLKKNKENEKKLKELIENSV